MAKETKDATSKTKKPKGKPTEATPGSTVPETTRGSEPFWSDWPALWRPFGLVQRFAEQPPMKLEEFDDDGTHVVRAEMPGIDPDKDVSVTVDHGVVTIRAERREQKKTKDKDGYRSEFSYGSFTRSVRLPAGATEADVSASYRDGILEIRFPIDTGEARARTIPISRT